MTDLEALEGQYPTGSERYFTEKYDRLRYKFLGSEDIIENHSCLLYTSPSPRDRQKSRMPSSA